MLVAVVDIIATAVVTAAVGVVETELGTRAQEEAGGVGGARGVDEGARVADHQRAIVLEDRSGEATAEVDLECVGIVTGAFVERDERMGCGDPSGCRGETGGGRD